MIFKDRVTIVTGASQGIGEAIAREFAREGAAIALVDVKKAQLEDVARSIAADGGRAGVYEADVTRFDAARAVVEAVIKDFGRIDHLVNNAGITRDMTFKKMDCVNWDAVMNSNLRSVFNMTKQVCDQMMERGWGRIINISSVNGQKGAFGQTNYSAAKAGMHGFTKALSLEVARKGVTVNTISPGYIGTKMVMAIPREAERCSIPRSSRRYRWVGSENPRKLRAWSPIWPVTKPHS